MDQSEKSGKNSKFFVDVGRPKKQIIICKRINLIIPPRSTLHRAHRPTSACVSCCDTKQGSSLSYAPLRFFYTSPPCPSASPLKGGTPLSSAHFLRWSSPRTTMHHLAILISSILCKHALGEWWIGSDVWRNMSTYGPLEAMGALSRWRQCPLHDFALGQRHEVILNTMIRRFSIHDEIKRPEYFPCTNM